MNTFCPTTSKEANTNTSDSTSHVNSDHHAKGKNDMDKTIPVGTSYSTKEDFLFDLSTYHANHGKYYREAASNENRLILKCKHDVNSDRDKDVGDSSAHDKKKCDASFIIRRKK